MVVPEEQELHPPPFPSLSFPELLYLLTGQRWTGSAHVGGAICLKYPFTQHEQELHGK